MGENGRFPLLYTTPLLEELVDVLNRPRLRNRYQLTPHYLHLFLHVIRLRGEKVEPTESVTICRDPDDNKFLEAAAAGKADFIVSKDEDLLVLSPFADTPIIVPAVFLAKLS